ncbi:uncharacterized protein PHACADRAFT_255589 [Phanerochaete carnosa HHB-10118-sp]|uniref:DUF3074 domain-containing protein n=1 Tax=Phanerochaete carnosa (strain HHB-10118-sp) TaxID=650164 RepID=K5WXE8_PHACS|nr:uncharacterized protein PHACADRAFT_255589 [Phanerochaete carnosa HHB-10118-sp]EKM55162.1 hypothetical protein PHACADRAFT_255589 [Phanerochaete carnosa HHB-10118-sp]
MATEYQLSVTPVKVTELPPEDKLIAQGHAIMDTTDKWKQGKTYHETVRTYSRNKFKGETANWHCRVSEHGSEDGTFEEFWNLLAGNKGENEVNYVEVVEKATLVKQLSPTQTIWCMFYKFPSPVKPRVFTVLQTIELKETSPRTGLVISIPLDLTPIPDFAKLEEKRVQGRYVSIERIKDLGDGRLEWRMATSSKAGGLLPQSLTEMSMPSSIAHDVPGFVNWLRTLREKNDGQILQSPALATEAAAAAADAHAVAVEA